MSYINNYIWKFGNYLSSIRVSDILDILIVAFVIYRLILLVRKTNAKNLAKGILIFMLVLGLSGLMNLTMTSYILKKAMELGLISIVILFQPELRRILEKIGSSLSSSSRLNSEPRIENAITQIVLACKDMSESKTGALIIFERDIKLSDIVDTGTVIDSEVSAELIKNIFYNKAPLHDGAMIIKDGRICAAGCVLPLTKSTNLSKDLGMRHRAGIGLSEVSDAVVVIVSEETGSISVAIEGMLKRHLKYNTFDKLLRTEIINDYVEEKTTGFQDIIKKVLGFDFISRNSDRKEVSDEENNR